MTKDKRVYIKRPRTMWDISEGERILHEEEQKANWKDYAEININLNKEMSKLYESLPPQYARDVSVTRHNLMRMRKDPKLNPTYAQANFWHIMYGSATLHCLGYLALLGISIWLFTGDI